MALAAARQKRPEAGQIYEALGQMSRDPAAPPELRLLGRVLQRLMIGDTNVDLSELPTPWADLIRQSL